MSDLSSTRRSVLLGASLAAVPGALANAQGALQPFPHRGQPPAPAPNSARANSGTVGVISGGIDGTYARIAADLATVLDDADRLRILPVLGKGSVQNVADIIFLRGIDVGIVQSDVLAYVLREQMFPGVASRVNYIAKLYDEEIHVLARPEIKRVEDLDGKPVNMDVRGSGTAMTASLLFRSLNIAVASKFESQANALRQLLDGDIAALVYVAGSPAGLFSSVAPASGLHFLTLPATATLLETYLPSQLSDQVYPALIAAGHPIDTLAVGAVMAAYAWQPGTERHGKIQRFVAAFSEKFTQFLRPPRHPKWKEVNLAAQVPSWTRFGSAPELRPSQPAWSAPMR